MPLLSIAGKTVQELAGSEEITYDREGGMVRRRLLCDWADGPAVCEALVGTVTAVGITSLSYTQPLPHPSPKFAHLIAQKARVSGLGPPAQDGLGIISYPKAVLEVEYLPRRGDSSDSSSRAPITFVTERRELAAEWLTLPKSKLYWASDDSTAATGGTQAVGEDARMLMVLPLTHLTVDVHWWFAADTRITGLVFDNAIGTTNRFPIRFLFTEWPAETLLFNGASFVRQYTTAGLSAWQVSLGFTYKRQRWNRAYRGPEQIATNGDGFWTYCGSSGQRIYQRLDFRALLP